DTRHRILDRRELYLDRITAADVTVRAIESPLNRAEIRADPPGRQIGEDRQRSPHLAGQEQRERFPLLRRRRLVDEVVRGQIAEMNRPGGATGLGDGETGERRPADLPLVDVEDIQTGALALRRR